MFGLSEDAARYAEQYPILDDPRVSYEELCDGWLPDTPQLALALYFRFARLAQDRYAERGIPDEIWVDTMSDLGIWALQIRPGIWGITEVGWLSRHLTLRLFRLGRLQFEPKPEAIEVHIPEGEPLLPLACDLAFDAAVRMFGRQDFHCHSWLLSPDLESVLPADSNIRAFATRFTLTSVDRADAQAYERITPGSTLHDRVHGIYRAGGNIRTAAGTYRHLLATA